MWIFLFGAAHAGEYLGLLFYWAASDSWEGRDYLVGIV